MSFEEKITIVCIKCKGEGKIMGNDESNIIKTCDICKGEGKIKGVIASK